VGGYNRGERRGLGVVVLAFSTRGEEDVAKTASGAILLKAAHFERRRKVLRATYFERNGEEQEPKLSSQN